ncbi:MAG TPA: hypothetical protein VLU96_03205 [Gaiellaceae bacterium]|nr:hypothetical protein [Gaiellaceae bacterium]
MRLAAQAVIVAGHLYLVPAQSDADEWSWRCRRRLVSGLLASLIAEIEFWVVAFAHMYRT